METVLIAMTAWEDTKGKSKIAILRWLSTGQVSPVVTTLLSVREVWGSILGPVKSTQCRQRLATAMTLLRSCEAQVLSRKWAPSLVMRFDVIAKSVMNICFGFCLTWLFFVVICEHS